MGANPLTEIPEGAFDNLVELEVLNFGENEPADVAGERLSQSVEVEKSFVDPERKTAHGEEGHVPGHACPL